MVCHAMAGKEKGREPFLKVLFDESLVIFGTDDMGAVAREASSDMVLTISSGVTGCHFLQ